MTDTATTSAAPPGGTPTSSATPGRGWVLALASAGAFMVALDTQVVVVALTTIRQEFGASIESLEWTVNAYILSLAVLLMTGSALGERFGRRRMYVVGLSIFALASAACALSTSVQALVLWRAVQGLGAALVMPLAVALLGVAYPREQRARALGIFSGLTGLAVLGGPVIGGAVAQGLAWQWIFWINLPLVALTVLLVLARVPESRGQAAPIDGGGVVLLTAGLLGLVWGLIRANGLGWSHAEVVTALAAGVVLTALFVLWQHRAASPMVPPRLFGSRAFSSGNAASFLLTASLYGTLFFMAQFFQAVQAQGPLGAGLRMLPWTATLFVVAPIAGRLVNRIGEKPLVAGGLLLQAAGMAWLALVASPTSGYAPLVPPLMLAGAGVSMAMPAVQAAVLGAAPMADIGRAAGIFNMLRQLGGVFGIAVLAAVFSHAGSLTSSAGFAQGFTAAIAVSAAFSLVGALAGLGLGGQRQPAPVLQPQTRKETP